MRLKFTFGFLRHKRRGVYVKLDDVLAAIGATRDAAEAMEFEVEPLDVLRQAILDAFAGSGV